MQHINTQEPNSKLSQKILEDFCVAAVEAIKTQYGREYGFANENEKKRAAVFSELHIDGLEGLPTNNLIAEIFLFIKFKAKTIRKSLNLINSDNFKLKKLLKGLGIW